MSQPRVSLDTVSAGQSFEAIPLDLSRDTVERFLETLEGRPAQNAEGVLLTPPSVVSSLSLGALLTRVALPDGCLHASQEVIMARPIPVGASALCEAAVSAVSSRGGLTFVTLDFTVRQADARDGDSGGDVLATGSGTVMFPAGGSGA